MVWLAIVAGGILGLMIGHDGEFAVIGAVLGWLAARSLRQQNEIVALRGLLQQRPAPLPAVEAAAARPAADAVTAVAAPVTPAEHEPIDTVPTPLPPTLESAPLTAAPLPTAARPRATTAASGPIAALRNWLFGGNTIVKAGIGILFIGLAFLAKYASEHVQVAVEWRLSAIAVVAIVLLVVGWRLRERRAGYAQVLQGGAVAVLYLVLFAAFRFYGVIGAGPAFALMALVAAFSAALAVLQEARALAVIGALGGFATPLLVSTGGGNFIALFSYYLVLDLGIAAVAWHRTWRSLNLIGFFATFIVATAWGVLRYRPDDYAASQSFLVAFFVLFVAILLMPSRHVEPDRPAHRSDGWVDGTLLFGLPTIAFALQWALVRQWPYAVALSALLAAGLYVALAAWMRGRPRFALAFEANLGVAVVLLTLVFPFAFDARATAGAWALEGAGLVWIGLRQSRWLARATGYALMLLAGVALAHDGHVRPVSVVNGDAIGALMVAAAALFAALQLHRRLPAERSIETLAEPLLIAWALWWLVSFAQQQITGFVEPRFALAAWIAAVSVIAALFTALAVACDWPKAAWPVLLHAPALALLLLASAIDGSAPFANAGGWAWGLALAAHLLVLHRAAPRWPLPPMVTAAHAIGAIVLAGVGALQFRSWTAGWGDAGGAWAWLGWGVFPALLLIGLLQPRAMSLWPISAQPQAYRQVAGGMLGAGLLLWTLLANWGSNGSAAPLPHVPLLNPLDLGIAIALMAAARWGTTQAPPAWPQRWPTVLIGGAAFAWTNAMLIRAFHHYGDVPYHLHAWTRSLPVQTGLTLLWSATALALMWRSARAGQRTLWLVGAALLGLVVGKLLLIDLSGTGTVTRIVSFIGVGALMLVIGYVAPLPARRSASAMDGNDDEPAAHAAR